MVQSYSCLGCGLLFRQIDCRNAESDVTESLLQFGSVFSHVGFPGIRGAIRHDVGRRRSRLQIKTNGINGHAFGLHVRTYSLGLLRSIAVIVAVVPSVVLAIS